MKRAHRLRRPEQFQHARHQGRRWESRLLILQAVANRHRTTRCGFVVSKRVSKHAVGRNRLKRLLGEAMRSSLPELSPGYDIVLNARKEALAADLRALEQDIPALLRRARLLAPVYKQETNS